MWTLAILSKGGRRGRRGPFGKPSFRVGSWKDALGKAANAAMPRVARYLDAGHDAYEEDYDSHDDEYADDDAEFG